MSDESWYINIDQPSGDSDFITENIFDLIFAKLKICVKWKHTHPHLKQFIQLFAVDSSEISIYMNLKVAVDRHTNVNKSKGASDSVTKNLYLRQYREN